MLDNSSQRRTHLAIKIDRIRGRAGRFGGWRLSRESLEASSIEEPWVLEKLPHVAAQMGGDI